MKLPVILVVGPRLNSLCLGFNGLLFVAGFVHLLERRFQTKHGVKSWLCAE